MGELASQLLLLFIGAVVFVVLVVSGLIYLYVRHTQKESSNTPLSDQERTYLSGVAQQVGLISISSFALLATSWFPDLTLKLSDFDFSYGVPVLIVYLAYLLYSKLQDPGALLLLAFVISVLDMITILLWFAIPETLSSFYQDFAILAKVLFTFLENGTLLVLLLFFIKHSINSGFKTLYIIFLLLYITLILIFQTTNIIFYFEWANIYLASYVLTLFTFTAFVEMRARVNA